MKDTDKVTLTVGQLKKLIAESKQLTESLEFSEIRFMDKPNGKVLKKLDSSWPTHNDIGNFADDQGTSSVILDMSWLHDAGTLFIYPYRG